MPAFALRALREVTAPLLSGTLGAGSGAAAEVEENDPFIVKITSERVVPVSDPNAPAFEPLDGDEDQQAGDAVREVIAFYSARIVAERRAPLPDDEHIEQLKAARQAAIDDQTRLETAGPGDAARIAIDYAARLKGLTGQA